MEFQFNFLNVLFYYSYYNILHAAAAKDCLDSYNFLTKNHIIDANSKDRFGVF